MKKQSQDDLKAKSPKDPDYNEPELTKEEIKEFYQLLYEKGYYEGMEAERADPENARKMARNKSRRFPDDAGFLDGREKIRQERQVERLNELNVVRYQGFDLNRDINR